MKINHLKIYTDGGARGNPGPSAVGIVIMNKNNEILDSYGIYIGKGTNNIAEYKAVKIALEKAEKYSPINIDCYIDSELVVRQLNGIYKVKNIILRELYSEIINIAQRYHINFNHISRKQNRQADEQVNAAIDIALGLK